MSYHRFAKKSLPLIIDGIEHTDDPRRPKGFAEAEELPNPGWKEFYCPGCDEVVQVFPIRDGEYWRYAGVCPDCKTTWSNLKPRFAKRPKPTRNADPSESRSLADDYDPLG